MNIEWLHTGVEACVSDMYYTMLLLCIFLQKDHKYVLQVVQYKLIHYNNGSIIRIVICSRLKKWKKCYKKKVKSKFLFKFFILLEYFFTICLKIFKRFSVALFSFFSFYRTYIHFWIIQRVSFISNDSLTTVTVSPLFSLLYYCIIVIIVHSAPKF